MIQLTDAPPEVDVLLRLDSGFGRIQRSSHHKAVDSLVGEVATALEDIPAGAIGKAELRGT